VLLDAVDRPVAEALLEIVTASPQRGSDPGKSWQVTTDDEGRFSLHGLEPGSYEVTVLSSNDELVDSTVHATRDEVPVCIRVKPGLQGHVLSDSGLPIEGAVIVAETPSGEAIDCTRSAGDGRFAITVPAGVTSVRLIVGHDAYAERDVTVVDVAGFDSVVLHAGLQITGVVTDASGTTVAGATIVLAAAPEVLSLVKSAADGSFVAGGLRHGVYELSVYAPGCVPSEPMEVAAGRTDVCLKVQRGEAIAGRVLFRERGSHLVWVEACHPDGESLVAVTASRDGRFELKGLPRGAYSIRAYRENSGGAGSGVRVDNVPTGTMDLEVRLPE
jgi:hypothetical protein